MSHGGRRNRSGPAPEPTSARSESRGLVLTALPNEGYQGEIPEWPLGSGPEHVAARELEIWNKSWRTPQAAAWAQEFWRWDVIAEYCRLKAIVEVDPSSSAALVTQLRRYRDELGISPPGLIENGWAIAQPQISKAVSADEADAELSEKKGRPERRMRAV